MCRYIAFDYTFLSKSFKINNRSEIALDFGVGSLPLTLWIQQTYKLTLPLPVATGCNKYWATLGFGGHAMVSSICSKSRLFMVGNFDSPLLFDDDDDDDEMMMMMMTMTMTMTTMTMTMTMTTMTTKTIMMIYYRYRIRDRILCRSGSKLATILPFKNTWRILRLPLGASGLQESRLWPGRLATATSRCSGQGPVTDP